METIIETFNNAIGWSILHSLWQGASIYLILFGLYLVFPQMSSSTKYRVAFLGQSLLFISFIYTFCTYINFQTIEASELKLGEKEELLLYTLYLKNKTWTISQLFPYLVVLYGTGLLVQISLFLKSFRFLNNIKKSSSTAIPEQWQDTLTKIIQKNRIGAKVRLLTSDQISTAITVGFLKPLIIFPTAYINNISKQEAEEILLHELAHINRYDYVFNMLLIVMETLLFFNPFVWLIGKHIKLEREQSCDDFVNLHLDNPISYSKTLLKVELLRQEAVSQIAMATSGHNKYDLFNRIKRINNRTMHTKYTSLKHQLLAMLLASLALVSLAWINPNTTTEEKSPIVIAKNAIPIMQTMLSLEDTVKQVKPTIHIIRDNKTEECIEQVENDSKQVQNLIKYSDNIVNIKELEKNRDELQKYFDSPEWKENIARIEHNARKVEEQFNSPEWKENIARIEHNARKVEEQFNSPEWKEKIARIEHNARKVEEQFNSPEWKEKIARIESNARKVEEQFNSPEWKEKIARIERNAREVEEQFNSPEWKEKVIRIERDARKVEELKNSSIPKIIR